MGMIKAKNLFQGNELHSILGCLIFSLTLLQHIGYLTSVSIYKDIKVIFTVADALLSDQ
jgi:hypothetical protein